MPRQRRPVGQSYGAAPARPDQQLASQSIQDQPGQQAVTAPTGLPYGEHSQLTGMQQAVPLPAATGAGAAPPVPMHPVDQAVAAVAAHPPPNVAPLSGPSQRPWEPTTTGLPTGPGPGPEVLGRGPAAPKVSQTYLAMYQQTGDPEYARLARIALSQGR